MTRAMQRSENTKTANGSKFVALPSRPSIAKITTDRDLFLWLWSQLEVAGPQIRVGNYVPSDIFCLQHSILSGQTIIYPPIEWTVIFAEIEWAKPCDGSGDQCSVPMLQFIGKLSETLILEGGGCVSPLRACEMMLFIWDAHGKYVYFGDGPEDGCYLVSTPACKRELGVAFRIKLNDEPMNVECWSLEGYVEL